MYISIIIPSKDEEMNLKLLIPKIIFELNNIKIGPYEVIILNHGSNDNTNQLINTFKKKGWPILSFQYPRYTIKLGEMLIDGIVRAHGDFIITMDADLSHDPQNLKVYIEEFKKKRDFVVGVRYNRKQPLFFPKQRYFISKLFNLLPRILIDKTLTDYTTGYRGFNKNLFNCIKTTIHSTGFEIHLELNGKLLMIAQNPVSIPISYLKRKTGKSKLRYYGEFLGYIKALYWIFKFSLFKSPHQSFL